MSLRTQLTTILFATAVGNPAMAGPVDPFKTEVDCGGIQTPGTAVPYLVDIEERVNQTHNVDVSLVLRAPNGREFKLDSRFITLQPNDFIAMDRQLRLPRRAPTGRYTLHITGASAAWTSTDTCSFHVQ